MKSLLPVRFSIFIVVCIESYFASTEVAKKLVNALLNELFNVFPNLFHVKV